MRSLSKFAKSSRITALDRSNRKGTILVLSAFMIIAILGMIAMSLDTGYMVNTTVELKRAADAGALAGAGVLPNGITGAATAAKQFVQANPVGHHTLPTADITVDSGTWNTSTRTFTVTGTLPSAVRVTATDKNQPLFFGRIFNKASFTVSATSIAQYQPRDIMLVLDLSASMNDDSTFAASSTLGQANIVANLQQIYNELGSPHYGNMTFNGVTINSTNATTIKSTLGITNVAYPCPAGSWTEYFSYVQGNGVNGMGTPTDLINAGYKKNYGYLTLIHYWLTSRPMHSETPSLCNVSEQPVKALKDAVAIFLSYMQSQQTDDQLGFVVYDAADGTAVLESGLTPNYSTVQSIVNARQAGHYEHNTNIGAGIHAGRLELQNHGRVGASKLIILMTDGQANRPTSVAAGIAYANSEAAAAAAAQIPIVTIALGASADTSMMQQIADTTGGVAFIIPGGQTATQYTTQLTAIFGQVADSRPLKLVQ